MKTKRRETYWHVVCRSPRCHAEFRNLTLARNHGLVTGHQYQIVQIRPVKGRGANFKGEMNPANELNPSQVRQILKLAATGGWSTYELSRHYKALGFRGVSQQNIWNIVNRKTWMDL